MGAPGKYTDEQRAEALRLYEQEGPTVVFKQPCCAPRSNMLCATGSWVRARPEQHRPADR